MTAIRPGTWIRSGRFPWLYVPTGTAVKRFVACMAASVVLAAMWSPVEGSSTDYAFELSRTIKFPRLWTFLALGLVVYLVITFWGWVAPYVNRPGVMPAFGGLIAVVCAYAFMRWNDVVGKGKFGDVSDAVDRTGGIPWLTTAYFGWLHWVLLIGSLVLIAIAVVVGFRPAAWAGAAVAVVAAYVSWSAHHEVADRAGGVDHSLGYLVAVVGYLIIAGAACVVAVSNEQVASTRVFISRVLGWRPGFVLAVLGALLGVLAFTAGRWYAPTLSNRNTTFSATHDLFEPSGLDSLAVAYLGWLAWTVLAVTAVAVLAASVTRSRVLGWVGAAGGAFGCVLTIYTIYKMSDLAARIVPTEGTTWNNLGTGGWMAAAGFMALGGAGLVVAIVRRGTGKFDSRSFLAAPGATQSAIIAAVAFALFFPPTMTGFWQQVLVTEIGPYLLLAVGLNVVVGWAGLLDLGYIAFFAVGCYFTAYLTGSLPIKPPDWLILPPLAAVPVAIVACALAGFLLGAPTLRLRGDYLAIVTLGFGEIIQLAANNADGITNGSRGTAVDPGHHSTNVPHPYIHLGPINVTWGENQLQYWYLLFVYLVLLVLAFRGLEHSRIGRAWAAVREDEVAAEASGVNTFRIKLLAFAIGASSSGVAGVFYGSQVGYFSPTDFSLIFSILVVAYVVFGGMGSLVGALAGAAALTWLPRFLQDQVPPQDKQMWIGAIVVLMMIFRPAGLVPAKRRRIEMSGGTDETPRAETFAVPRAGSMGGAT